MAKMQADASQSDKQYAQVTVNDDMEHATGDYPDDDLGPGAQGPGSHPHKDDRSIGNHPHQDDRSNGAMNHPHRGLNRNGY